MMTSNFEKFTKRNSKKDIESQGRKMNKVKRDRSHKRGWEVR